ncbi:hypothetical protein U8P76_29110 (plasmid) [Rhizobium johnstonii]|nr:hypothetical protein U8P76_29110 [Rhizobium johnstonii]
MDIGVDKAHALVANLGGRLDAILEGDRVDFGRTERIDVASECEERRQQLDAVFSSHFHYSPDDIAPPAF